MFQSEDTQMQIINHLSNDFRSLGVPTECTIVFSAREKEIGILFAPRERQNAFLVTGQDLQCLVRGEECYKNMMGTFSGARALRRSQTMMMGEVSSSEAVTSLVALDKSRSDT